MDTEKPLEVIWGPASLTEVQAHSGDDGAIMPFFEGRRVVGM